uniref:NADH dehydrogenase subunit 2 n=1 Tax=Argyresthia conjugella TaxID=687015 RepID=UPI002A810DF7|nr:NADH dehydrogenase subunit 2 [Argyresthia conjugella]WOK81897.1 NADH dehydrogenase subunit 2 [Argyresthia conjugella]
MNFFLNSNKMFFLFMLFFSTMISISSNSWLGCWMGLEINLLSFIPLISNVNNLLSSETSMKYFLVQSIASINLLFLILLKMTFMKFYEFNNFFIILMNLSLLMKMGSVPFHFWYINIMEGLSWFNCFILMTWQKISPMILLSYFYNMNFLFLIMILNVMIGGFGGINQISIRKILTFSSINNLGWMLMSMLISENLWLMYFFLYSLMTCFLCFLFYFLNIFFFNQLFYSGMKNMIKLSMFLNMLSLGGLPPFLGFFPKWIIINFMIMNNLYLLTFIFIMMSLIMLFFYIRITYSSLMINYLKLKWFKIKMKNYSLIYFNNINFISLLGLPLSTFFYW